MKQLKGKIVRQIWLSDGEDVIQFICQGGETIAFVTDGDCCSETWISDLIGVSSLIGHRVLETQELVSESVQFLKRSRQEVDILYGYALLTERGYFVLAFRNSSNGYYGGDLHFIKKTPQKRVWRMITRDWGEE